MIDQHEAVETDFQTLQEAGVIPMPPRELDESDMERLHQDGTVFTVHRITEEDTPDYGLRYTLFCEGPDHESFLIRFWANPVRDPIILSLKGITKTHKVTGIRLASQKRGKMTMYIPSGQA